jgi:hypothetical protein
MNRPTHATFRSAREALPPIRTLALASIVLGSVGGGALLGAALTAFLTPTTGPELRRKLARVLARDEDESAGYDSGEYDVDGDELVERHAHEEPPAIPSTSEEVRAALHDLAVAVDIDVEVEEPEEAEDDPLGYVDYERPEHGR